MKKIRIFYSPFVFFLAVSICLFMNPSSATAQAVLEKTPDYSARVKAVEEKLEARRRELGIPGMSLAIVKDNQIIYLDGLGYKDFENRVAVTPDTQFAIGSATKAFTALLVLMSQDEGKISIEDSPKKYLPYFKINDADTDKNIKIRHLLSHSSGLSRTDLAWISGKLTREEIIRVTGEAKPTARLNEKYQYQNVMFAAAGEIVARLQKKTWENYLSEKILKPLGMNNSSLSLKEMIRAKDYSFGYEYNFVTKETRRMPFVDADEIAPAGSINSSARDMAQWLKFVLNGGLVNEKRLISEKSYGEWFTPQIKISSRASYGLGWFLQDWRGLKVVQHGGNIDGFNSLVAMIPERKIGFVMLTNVSGSSLGAELMPIIWEGILDEAEIPVAKNQAVGAGSPSSAVSSSSAKELVGRYVSSSGKSSAEIREADGKVIFDLSGQQPAELREKQKDFYAIYPLPEPFALKITRDSSGKITGFTIIQPQSEVAFSRVEAAETPKITVEELTSKIIEELGGENALRKIKSRKTEFELDFENQGLKGYGTTFSETPNAYATKTTITALSKKIAEGFDYFDGQQGGQKTSFSPFENYSGTRLEDVKQANDFYGFLNWKNNLKTIEIKGVEKVANEDAYVVSVKPEKASEIIYYISAKTFLPLKRTMLIVSSTSNFRISQQEFYEDYRLIDGIKIPFKISTEDVSNGRVISYIKKIEHNIQTPKDVYNLAKN